MFYGAGGVGSPLPLLSYSDSQDRATIVRESFADSTSMPSVKRKRSKRAGRPRTASKKGRKHRVKGTKGVRVTKGRVSIRLPGHGVTKLAASQLVRYVPLNKLKSAAKKVLRSLGRVVRHRKKKGRKTTRRRRR
jgi:hypothetical protein